MSDFNRKKTVSSTDENVGEARVVYGRNPVRELIENGKPVDRIIVKRGEYDGSISVIVAKARERGITVSEADGRKLDAYAEGGRHQGVVAFLAPMSFFTVKELLDKTSAEGNVPFFLILDGIEDPQNLGAILRSAECAGANGVIVPKHHCAPLSPSACKASAGAVEYIPIAKVTNLTRAIDELKDAGLWIYGADADGEYYGDVDLSGPAAFVLGSEGHGISRLVRENCDKIISIPLHGKINSLNVSAAAAVILYAVEASRNIKK
ncbi:MAG: 23S rRNA (guanosine(2251)-2'-O)-methyltransferase RlmB [Clostridia bacterium]|nr:23S rRNA (guanosine(2251)-2'-O)-methyltransferase RlmB [Clostridia bacterium]